MIDLSAAFLVKITPLLLPLAVLEALKGKKEFFGGRFIEF